MLTVAESGPKIKDEKLAIMDQDGANTKYLTLGNELVLTQDLTTNQMLLICLILEICPGFICWILKQEPKRVGNFPGMTLLRFSPDGKKTGTVC